MKQNEEIKNLVVETISIMHELYGNLKECNEDDAELFKELYLKHISDAFLTEEELKQKAKDALHGLIESIYRWI